MRFVGVDLHKHTITVVVVDAARKLLVRKRFSNLMSIQIIAFLKTLGEFQLTVEATASYEWFVQLVEPLASRVVLAQQGSPSNVFHESRTRRNGSDDRIRLRLLQLGECCHPTTWAAVWLMAWSTNGSKAKVLRPLFRNAAQNCHRCDN